MPDMTGVPSYGPCGDSNLAMKAIIQGGKNAVLGTPFGHVHRAQHEVGFNKRTFEPQSQVPDFVNTINSSVFTISTTMGHLMQNMYMLADFQIIPKGDTDLNSYIKDWEKDIKWQDDFQHTDGATGSDGTTKLMPFTFTRSAAHITTGSPYWDGAMNAQQGGWAGASTHDTTNAEYAGEMYWDRRGSLQNGTVAERVNGSTTSGLAWTDGTKNALNYGDGTIAGGAPPTDGLTTASRISDEFESGVTKIKQPRMLTKKLENIKLHKDGLFGIVSDIEMMHNSIVFHRTHRWQHRNTKRELYNRSDHNLLQILQHGGQPSYIWFEPFDDNVPSTNAADNDKHHHTKTRGSSRTPREGARSVMSGIYRYRQTPLSQWGGRNNNLHALAAKEGDGTPNHLTGLHAYDTFNCGHFKIHREALDARDGYVYLGADPHRELAQGEPDCHPTAEASSSFGWSGYTGIDQHWQLARAGFDGMVDTTYHQNDQRPACLRPRKRLSQFQLLQKRAPLESKYNLVDKYKPELYTEIGCKDLPGEMLAAPQAGKFLKKALGRLRDDNGIILEQAMEVPHPWHYNVSDSFPILNLVNDMQVTVNYRNKDQWIQNAEEVNQLWEWKIRRVRMIVLYYDVPKEVWDNQFPLNRQMNYTKHDYQSTEKDFALEIECPGVDTHQYENSYNNTTRESNRHRNNVHNAQEFSIGLNAIDGVVRYLVTSIGGQNQSSSGGAWDHEDMTFANDIVGSAWLQVGEEKVNDAKTVDATVLDPWKVFVQRHQHFKEMENFLPGSTIYFPLGLDCDIHNYGGGSTNFKPFSQQCKMVMRIDPWKIDKLYKAGIPYVKYDGGLKGAAAIDGDPKALENACSRWVGADGGSLHGFIERKDNKYVCRLKVRVSALILSLVTSEGGQLFAQ